MHRGRIRSLISASLRVDLAATTQAKLRAHSIIHRANKSPPTHPSTSGKCDFIQSLYCLCKMTRSLLSI